MVIPDLVTIGELAAEFSLSPRAIRFYEDQGLLSPERVGAQRVYGRRERARLRLILRGKRLGFSLADIRDFLDLYEVGSGNRRQMQMTLERTRSRIAELEQQMADLTLTLSELRDLQGDIEAYLQSDPKTGPREFRR